MRRVLGALDGWQRRNRVAGPAVAVLRKFSDDDGNALVVALAWYGFTAISPVLLVVVTVFGFVGISSLGDAIVTTLHQFPVIGSDFTHGRGAASLHGNPFGLVVGLAGLLYGARGVTRNAQTTMARVWGVPRDRRPGFLANLGRSLADLSIIGLAFVLNAFVAGVVTASGQPVVVRVLALVGLLVCNVGLYLVSFWVLTPNETASWRRLLPGALLAGAAFTLLSTVGSGLVQHQLRNASNTYGAFASVIGVVTYLLLVAHITVYAAELNVVLARGLWPRALLEGVGAG